MAEMGRPKGAIDVAPRIRKAFIRACKNLERRNVSLTDIIERNLEERPLETLKVISQFNPRQVQVEQEHKIEISHIIEVVTERQQAKLAREKPPLVAQVIEHESQAEHIITLQPASAKAIAEG